jgi:hypothetical protein
LKFGGIGTATAPAAGESIVRYLAAHGGRLDAKTRDGKTPYDVAIGRKDGSGRQLLPGTLVAFRELGAPKSIGEDANRRSCRL